MGSHGSSHVPWRSQALECCGFSFGRLGWHAGIGVEDSGHEALREMGLKLAGRVWQLAASLKPLLIGTGMSSYYMTPSCVDTTKPNRQ